jgi:uncharacterized cupin superfamily protein
MNPILNVADAEDIVEMEGAWGSTYKVLTPSMRPRGGTLGVCQNRVPPGHTTSPFHWHLREDEVFFIQSGRGVLRYGDTLYQLKPGDCVSCPAGTQIAHQIANPYDEELVYLAIGVHDPHEVCGYPDSGKMFMRGAKRIGFIQEAAYMAGEPEPPRIFGLAKAGG